MMYSMSIQGPKARGLFVPPEALFRFREMVAALVMDYVMVISTPYRTDILYQADTCHAEVLYKAWFVFCGHAQAQTGLDSLHLAEGKEEVLQYYFTSLGYLMSNSYAFGEYQKQFNRLWQSEPNNPIMGEISRCDKHLQAKIGPIRMPLVQAQPSTNCEAPIDSKAFAQQTQGKASLN